MTTICALVFLNLRQSWVVIPWLVGIGIWAAYFSFDRVEQLQLPSGSIRFDYGLLLFVLLAAAAVRLYRVNDFPLGANVDEIFTLNNSLLLLEKPFDPFGQTPLISEGWVETPNLYLYFNLFILKVAGVSYWSMKLLSVIPGVIASGGVYLIAQVVSEKRVAFCTALLFSFAYWPVRLSRYGWDASFMVMSFSLAIWLLLLALQRGRPLYAYLSGMMAGLGLYGYLGARVCLASLIAFFLIESIYRRRAILKQLIAFVVGSAAVSFPLFCYYFLKPAAFWIRTKELSVLNGLDPLAVVLKNIWRHALMFHVTGATFARDNFPGLPAMDPLTGFLFIVGIVIAIRHRHDTFTRLVACAFLFNFAGGVFSTSQEGPPYIYRTAAVMIPAFLIMGMGVQWLMLRKHRYVAYAAIPLALIVNLYLYFGLEAKNSAAMRVMSYELRQIGQEIAQDDLPVFMIGADALSQTELYAKPNEKYASANPAVVLPPVMQRLAVINFSGRYAMTKPVSENLVHPANIHFVESLPHDIRGPAKIIFKGHNPDVDQLLLRPGVSVRELRDIFGQPLRTVVTVATGA
jgi:4-amino-4-deoxy-L-arabinose transferase-like glycosyltransferase